ncbi:hypothetical protein GIB67_041206 [Kingdonia uniflora]|uniref:ZF-HD dimerization-type domain-containing protein n=1 Tax=Kingdonia uniflora TaxID=39325 RepID=A0A7J7NAS9_9MAGN|nr:hypothetical protein GIB67_041206 [Kingdonia uniflora]
MRRQKQSKKASNGTSTTVKSNERGVKYKECRKNHAANIGGYAVDGCREFMASGEEGTTAGFVCAACNCHRNFHRKEIETENYFDCSSNSTTNK